MLKTFKDVNGDKVNIGNPVSLIDENREIMIVSSIERSRRKIVVCLYSNLTNRYCYANSKKLILE